MLNLKNSLVNLITILFSLFFLTVSSADNDTFIFPKKKIITIKKVEKKQIEIKKSVYIEVDLPQKKPIDRKILKSKDLVNLNKSINLVKKKDLKKNKFSSVLPVKKPLIQKKENKQSVKKPYLEDETKKTIKLLKKETASEDTKQIVKTRNIFLYPSKKPLNYSTVSTKIESKSKILKEKDYIKAKNIFNLIRKGKWITALQQTKKVKDKEFRNLVTWLYLKERGNQATFNDYKNFIIENSDYPRISRLKYMAEHKIILENTSPKAIINWFDGSEPLSGTGKIKLGEAYLKIKQDQLAINLIKTGWVKADLSLRDLKYYRKKFNKILTTQDHLKRADYLAWNNKYWDLKRMLRYLPQKEKLLYNARFILMTNSYGVDKAISNVPQEFINDLGLQYNRLKWRARRNRLEGSLEILRKFHGEEVLIYPELWWKLRENISRDLIYAKKYDLAYEVASNHHLTEGPEFADAEWISGWLALSFLNKNKIAKQHFENFYKNVGYPISLARGAFWLGLAHEKSNNQDKAKTYYKESARFTNTYYGQLSFNKIYSGKDFKLSPEFKVTNGYEKIFMKNKLIRHVILLKEMDRTKFSKDILKHLATLNVEKGSEILAAKLSTEAGRYDYAIQIAKQASYEKRFINTYNYPIISTPLEINNKQMPSQELILAIIRQESEFDARANSYVGAQGLMQLMPSTARLVARNLKITYNKSSLKTNPEYNIKLGTSYFNSLLEDYDGVFPFAIGAYNAGPNRIKSWVKRYGDPNRGEMNFIDWIELIRFKETRNYVQRVIENINVYKYILNKDPIKIDGFFKL
jgi:soluble lytic murein transglycosylase